MKGVVNFTPRPPLPPENNRGTHCTRGGVGPRTDLDAYGKQKISPHPPGFERRAVQAVTPTHLSGHLVMLLSVNVFWGDTVKPGKTMQAFRRKLVP
jgi:hypothetical protein